MERGKPTLDELALDSNCLSYVIDALTGIAEPRGELADEKRALVRLYLYTPGTLWTLPTVRSEFERIKDADRRANHLSWTNVLFGVRAVNNPQDVESRAEALSMRHGDLDDCRVLAEAEDVGFTALLSYDFTFIARLAPAARLSLTSPSAYWGSLGVPRGAPPLKVPSMGNPLALQRWWRW